jgi:hypothetical protein
VQRDPWPGQFDADVDLGACQVGQADGVDCPVLLKIAPMAAELRVLELCYTAVRYSLMTPPRIFRRWTRSGT